MIYIEVNKDMQIEQVHYNQLSVVSKYGKSIMGRVYGIINRKKGMGFSVKENFWAKLPSTTKLDEIPRRSKEQVKDLQLRFLMNEYSKKDMSVLSVRNRNLLLHTMKQVLLEK